MERVLGRVGFLVVFQEVATFQLKLSNFQAHINREVLDTLLAEATGASAPGGTPEDRGDGARAGEGAAGGGGDGAGTGGKKDAAGDATPAAAAAAAEGGIYFLRAVFDLNKTTRSPPQRFAMHRVSAWDRQELLRA